MKILNYYTTLHLPKESTCEELYEECKNLFLKFHPNNDKSEDAFRKFVLVNDAYSILLKTTTREKYDYLLEKYVEGATVDPIDKSVIEEIMNLIFEQRKSMKKTLSNSDSNFISQILEVPFSFSNQHATIDTNLLEGFSLPDQDINFDINFFDSN